MVRRSIWGAAVLSLLGAACSSGTGNPTTTGTGGAAGGTSTGSAGAGPVDAGDAGDAPSGPCVTADDCPPTGDPCMGRACMAGTCTAVPAFDFAGCDDGDPCTENDYCMAGACTGSPLTCPDVDACNTGTCDPQKGCVGKPANDGATCDDGDACTGPGTCAAGVCQKGPAIDCSSMNGPCAQGTCDPQKGCVATPLPDGAPCDDGSTCTTGTTCHAGVCGGGQGPVVYFADDFHDNSKGWTLGMEWQIGPAMASGGQQFGNPDPAQDHSPSADNGVAGVVLGGNEYVGPQGSQTHGFYYLTSPPINTAAATGPVVLGFYRWLNSDMTPYMTSVIEVYNGTTWTQLYKSGSQGVTDSAWTYASYDVTAYKNAAMQVRFGFNIGMDQVYAVGSWNIDDVLVASAACP